MLLEGHALMIRFTLALLACFPLASQDYRIAPGGESRVEAIVEKTGLLSGKKHLLRWEKFSGTFSESSGAVSLTVEAASIVVLDDWIGDGKKEDVRKETVGKNVLHAEKYPQIRFASAGPAAGGPNEFTVKKISEGVYEGECSFAMTAFGVKPPKALLGAIGTKDEMTVRFRIAGAK
jgi:polyisoprenoid-binding protein YceI